MLHQNVGVANPEPQRRIIVRRSDGRTRTIRFTAVSPVDAEPVKRFGLLLSEGRLTEHRYELRVSRHFSYGEVLRWLKRIGGG